MPIEVRELHIRVVVQDTSKAALGSASGELAVEEDTSHKPGGGRDVLIGGVGADHIDASQTKLFSFTKVMLRTDQDPGSEIDSFVFEDSRSGELEFDPQGRLLLGSDQDIWRDALFGDGKDDLGPCQLDIDADLPFSTVDTGGIPVCMAEYALLLC
jgi:hypothetical protein